ncbi:molybdopterin-synthase adenylyltransferase MoeB [Methylacidimicrobium tartarophylax]|uniref:Molybdopterin-synthase adenylyltransferase n=1 Tax=Methylacidimicrobium tartarophylax TaxID=1041768 RepID=A0A5E6MMA9_9BACT|nr:molybdopterin-synthase adenylyltransferase MoeB [Methylacidimicrobium tartarophylax]VVM06554.1 putative adenylyltransferase/sulfurtransferase MoeZ [Methylacidimicrobium tartarophylax]
MSYLPRVNKIFPTAGFSHEEIRRYGRHLIMPEVTLEGQKRLKSARVLAVGTGGLGSPLLLYLAAAGVGRLGIVDFDTVDESNLQRQVLHKTRNIGKPKIESAIEAIQELNPNVEVVPYQTALRSENALEILRDYDVIVDGTDNFPTRYLVNDACVLLGKPNVYGSIFRFEGQATVFWAERGPCYRCLYPEPPDPGMVPSCAEGGVLGVLPGLIGMVQAIETVKLILGLGDPLIGRLLLFDALGMEFRQFRLRKDPACPICGSKPEIRELVDYEVFCGIGAPTAVDDVPEITVQELKRRLDGEAAFDLIDVREPHEVAIAQIPGAKVIPLSQFHQRIHELDSAREIVLFCKLGPRSAKACRLLFDSGFRKVQNLAGGIEAWSLEIDPSVPRY